MKGGRQRERGERERERENGKKGDGPMIKLHKFVHRQHVMSN